MNIKHIVGNIYKGKNAWGETTREILSRDGYFVKYRHTTQLGSVVQEQCMPEFQGWIRRNNAILIN